MTEGCEGGWPHFHAYFAENGHLVSEDCAPYEHSTSSTKCSKFQHCPAVAKVKNSHDVGGAYGLSSEKQMMKEVLRNGVLNTEFQAPAVFSTYKEGLVTAEGFQALHALAQAKTKGQKAHDISDDTLIGRGEPWEKLNHSVVLLGWGVDETGEKFWHLRNSYGQKWGQSGDFMLRRGHDDLGLEGEQVAFEPELL